MLAYGQVAHIGHLLPDNRQRKQVQQLNVLVFRRLLCGEAFIPFWSPSCYVELRSHEGRVLRSAPCCRVNEITCA